MINKIFVSTLLCLLLFSNHLFSQVRFGIKAGGSSSSFVGSGVPSFSSLQKTSYHFGGFINIPTIPRFSFQAELLVNRKGAPMTFSGNYQGDSGTISITQKLTYFETPLILQLNFGKNAASKFHLDAGIVPNWLMTSKYDAKFTYKDANGLEKESNFDYTIVKNTQDMNYIIGFGLIASKISFDFRYEMGTKPIYIITDGIPNLKNRTFMVSVGYFFN